MKFIITGGSSGLGRELVSQLVRDGHDVGFTYFTNEDAASELLTSLREAHPDRVVCCQQLDQSQPDAVEHSIQNLLAVLVDVDVLINNAAKNLTGLAIALADQDWDEVIQTNLSGYFYVTRALLMHFLSKSSGRIIHIGSVSDTGLTGQIAYNASKAALIGLSGTLAQEYGSKGITSNILRLGLIDTQLSAETASATTKDHWINHCPLKRLALAKDIYAAVQYLSGPGGEFINGATIPVTGGLNQL